MVKAVIFDCFGVLAQGSLGGFYDRHFKGDEAITRQARDLEQASSRGMISHDEWLGQLANLANISAPQADRELTDNPPNESLFSYIRNNLKDRYKIGFLSNASDDFLSDLFSDEQLALFDDFVISYQVRLAKPDRQIYKLAANRLTLMPEECVFVDDIEQYCTAARDAGMSAVQYRNFDQFERDIHKLLH